MLVALPTLHARDRRQNGMNKTKVVVGLLACRPARASFASEQIEQNCKTNWWYDGGMIPSEVHHDNNKTTSKTASVAVAVTNNWAKMTTFTGLNCWRSQTQCDRLV